MTPLAFPESNRTLNAPEGMDNCSALPVWSDGQQCISCWRPNWRERLSILFFGRVWIWVWSGHTQPPIALAGERQIFSKGEQANG